jgi:alpha-acetolactate decarboxylase
LVAHPKIPETPKESANITLIAHIPRKSSKLADDTQIASMMQAKNKFTRVKNLRRSNYVDTIFNATGKRTVAAEKMALRDGC